ncbi:hypothetical protein BV898_02030 [Hypsibius exemplaris]|uniref:Uncharacterized protein n=1 Tax=Hypsibius exemplaris TaxID=2072580 RepID=A0A1W0X953_HYPEX|nr:hypothetical protein BV898_02030 [Hypsibius exemplaris]
MTESHSEEVEQAIWRMYRSGEDIKGIQNKLRVCDLFKSRKLINLAIRRGQLTERINNEAQLESAAAAQQEQHISEDVMVEEMEIDGGTGEKHRSDSNVEGEEVVTVTTEEEENGAGTSQESFAEQLESIEEPITPEAVIHNSHRARRVKTTDDMIARIRDSFRRHPDMKVKDRAAEFGIAVGTLCQIKHNILQMPKESGRTWKSTSTMVENIRADIEKDATVKVKDRADKFGISVGTLCRIMHDILGHPKRVVQRSGTVRAPRVSSSSVGEMDGEGSTSGSPRRALKRQKRTIQLPSQLDLTEAQKKNFQLCLKTDVDGQVIVLQFDQNSSGHLQNEAGTSIPQVGTDELVWVVTSPDPEVEHVEGDFASEPESGVPLPENDADDGLPA